ncbi:MerR family transcriptional regulator [Enterococcus cecorum]|uniref:MerR family transcriptional regulator n=1 Tax=Enterococcus cecorum TaxID=44008 RepID=UPI000AAB1A5B|nr:MerR family transcriptional regulator [Enterococcus cecorum]MCJ0544090.1 MerR family transcriptional regulator [Enterococcus cecorum]MCJ0548943.1 MerR family transcriptional regulator [Enterococcus cecorum]MCJ0553667.1 MerR family transcriptional regulator [Enterococcus cecorum]MCJ0558740.1 MerR family transcriptional regulator [Enterococcus cecorum]CAI3298462.1 MerR family transcriptional regulator [Enterococcus cecorum]
MEKSQLFTIHQLAKFTGIPIKALRYYEKIQILTPRYIDETNRYRYYSYDQVTYVNIIKMCANYGIPLKNIQEFMIQDNKIDMQKIINLMQQLLEEKQNQLQKDRAFLHNLQSQINISKQVHKSHELAITKEHNDYLLQPFMGEFFTSEYYVGLQKMLECIQERHIQYYNRMGCFICWQNGELKKFLVLEIEGHTKQIANLQILHLQNQEACICHIQKNELDKQLEQLIKEGFHQFLILETFEATYHMHHPHLELQILH